MLERSALFGVRLPRSPKARDRGHPAEHAKALRWDYIALNAFYSIAAVLFLISVGGPNWHVDSAMQYSFRFGSAIMLLSGMIFEMRHRIYDSQVATLKELKQVQFQMLEIQETLRKEQ
jgi:hypothetical protein